MTLVKEFGLKYRGPPTKGSYLLRIFANLLLDAEVGINLLDYSINVNIFKLWKKKLVLMFFLTQGLLYRTWYRGNFNYIAN